ncbi:MAG: SDR family oxidoreductase [Candidatus Saganbacteria bacterium]|nr:SDR family oxidoreductase [Candidatus Saganbacteria bacterium]
MSKTVLITGSSSGIGKATAKLFQAKGWNVIATMRTPEKEQELNKLPNLICLRLDVTKSETIAQAIQEGIAKFGEIDVVINNAGYGMVGPFEAAAMEKIERQFDTNVLGPMAVIKAILPHFRAKKKGVIVNITSMAGRATFPLYALYNSTKWALEGFSEALSFELDAFNIRIKIVEPGVIETDFAGRSADICSDPSLKDYDDFVRKASAGMGKSMTKGTKPEKVADVIYKAATDKNKKMRYMAGNDARLVWFMRRIMPEDWFISILKRVLIR